MTRRPRASRMVALSAAALLVAAAASAQEVHVVTSGGFTEAHKQLAPRFERDTHIQRGQRVRRVHGRDAGRHSEPA